MEKTFTYFDVNDEEVEYTANRDELLSAVVDCVYNTYYRDKSELSLNISFCNTVKIGLRNFIIDCDNLESLVDEYERDLKDYFKEDAFAC